MKKSMMMVLMCAATVVCGVAKGETVEIPLEGGCDTLAYSVNGGPAVEVSLTGEAYADATALELDLGHNGAYVVELKKSGSTVKTYNWNVTDAEVVASESGMTEAMLDTREVKTIAGTTAETITYSADGWGVGGSGVTVGYLLDSVAAKTLKEAADSGAFEWKPTVNGRYVFSHAVTDGTTETAVVVVNGLPGSEGDPWEIGTGVTAYVKDLVVYLQGEGEVDEFAGDAPWAEYEKQGCQLVGAYLPRTVTLPASVLATLPFSVKGGMPSGAISAGFESIEVLDGKAYLGVAVKTNVNLTAEAQGWGKVGLEAKDVSVENGSVIIAVPANTEQGFMVLESGAAK